ncbi:unnamed protein product [Pseudo-nitzschia multistriata]|uniref:Uncharacterized protein n=1 Tax=Pseudo-nitzschia multistriata TaxID=183589 RepID=A0A448ZAI8_9STRA|nr:unnamed protein product [Pseudo-nitzschia multistriata]
MPISQNIFDAESQARQSLSSEFSVATRGPLHTASSSPFQSSNAVLRQQDHFSSSSNSRHGPTNVTHPQQTINNQQLESSVADTCRWLIDAGVPMSAFDPVSIGDISRSAPLAVPQLNTSATSSFSPTISQKTVKQEIKTGNSSATNIMASVDNIGDLAPQMNSSGGNDNNYDLTSLFTMSLPSNNSSASIAFDNDHLLTDLLPGENLPLVDDSLWAL